MPFLQRAYQHPLLNGSSSMFPELVLKHVAIVKGARLDPNLGAFVPGKWRFVPANRVHGISGFSSRDASSAMLGYRTPQKRRSRKHISGIFFQVGPRVVGIFLTGHCLAVRSSVMRPNPSDARPSGAIAASDMARGPPDREH